MLFLRHPRQTKERPNSAGGRGSGSHFLGTRHALPQAFRVSVHLGPGGTTWHTFWTRTSAGVTGGKRSHRSGQRRPRFSNEPPGLSGHQHGDFLLADKPVGCGPGGLHSDSRPVVTQGPWLPTKGRFT